MNDIHLQIVADVLNGICYKLQSLVYLKQRIVFIEDQRQMPADIVLAEQLHADIALFFIVNNMDLV